MKRAQNCVDSVDTHNDSPDNPIGSFNLRNNLSLSRIQKVDEGTITDQLICNCACEEIPKLKEKAHKSFMQVIQIENLYKEQIAQLKEYYGERQKNKDKQYKYKEQLLNEKCKQLEAEIQKIKQTRYIEKAYEIQIQTNPFSIDNIDTISYNPLLDESNESSIFNLKEFVNKKNIAQYVSAFQKQFKGKLTQIQSNSNPENMKVFTQEAISIADKIFEFIKELKDETVTACEKYNQIIKTNFQSEGKHTKLISMYESLQKQGKFMTDHIKRLSQQKIKMEKRINELQRSNKALEDYIKHIKKASVEKSGNQQSKKEKEIRTKDLLTANQDAELDLSIQSLFSSKTHKRYQMIAKKTNPTESQHGFKKKGTLFQKIQK